MGGCATKPKVAKDGEQQPEPEQEPQLVKDNNIVGTKQEPLLQEQEDEHEPQGINLRNFEQAIDDDQANRRRSLSLLFNKENQDEQVSTENEKTKAEETVKHEALEDKKPLEDTKSKEVKAKHESPKKEEKVYHESKINEPAEKQEPAVIVGDVEEVFSLQNQHTVPAKEIVMTEIPEAAKKTSEETIIIVPATETVVKQNQNTNAVENEDTNVSREIEKTKADETVKQETFVDKKPLEDAKISEPTVKQESPKREERLLQETKSNEAATKQESPVDAKIIEPTEVVAKIIEPAVKHESPKKEEKLSQGTKNVEPVTKQESAAVVVEEKPTLQNKITDSAADVIVKTKTPVVEETAVKQNQNAIAPEVIVTTVTKTETPKAEKVLEKTKSNVLNEPIKQEKPSETNPIEHVVVSPRKKKIIEEVVLPKAESVENKAVDKTSSLGEKRYVDAVVEHTPKASDVSHDKASLS